MPKSIGKLNKQNLGELGEAQILVPGQADHSQQQPPELPKQQRTSRRSLQFVLLSCAVVLVVAGAIGGFSGLFSDRWQRGAIAVEELTSVMITLNTNSHPQVIASNSTTVGEFLSEQRIRLSENDYIGLEMDQSLYDGMKIWLRLSVPIQVKADGETYLLESQPITVGQALDQAGIVLGELDEVDAPLLSYIYQPTTVTVSRVWEETLSEEEEIEPPQVEKEFTYLAPGSSEVVTPGRSGLQRSTYRVTFRDGVEIKRELLETVVTREPEEMVVGVGPAVARMIDDNEQIRSATTESGAEFYYSDSFTIEATAYTWTGNTTATGTWPKIGTIAVDPTHIPLGSKVYVVGYGFATAEDTGGAIKGNIIDLYMDTEQDCLNWGRRNVTIYLLSE